jgi:hypothetical protein
MFTRFLSRHHHIRHWETPNPEPHPISYRRNTWTARLTPWRTATWGAYDQSKRVHNDAKKKKKNPETKMAGSGSETSNIDVERLASWTCAATTIAQKVRKKRRYQNPRQREKCNAMQCRQSIRDHLLSTLFLEKPLPVQYRFTANLSSSNGKDRMTKECKPCKAVCFRPRKYRAPSWGQDPNSPNNSIWVPYPTLKNNLKNNLDSRNRSLLIHLKGDDPPYCHLLL